MKTPTLQQAVSRIKGKRVTLEEAKEFAHTNYMELCMFHRHEDKCIELLKLKTNRVEFKTMLDKKPIRDYGNKNTK